MTEVERTLRASRAGKALHRDPAVTQRVVARACRGTRRKFAAMVDPERALSPDERDRLIAIAQKAYMSALSGLGVKARRRKRHQQAQIFSALGPVVEKREAVALPGTTASMEDRHARPSTR